MASPFRTDLRLPDGGGYTLEGLYNVTAAAAARPSDNIQTLSKNVRRSVAGLEPVQPQRHRAAALGLTLQGGFNYARTPAPSVRHSRGYARVPSLPRSSITSADQSVVRLTRRSCCAHTALGSYMIPKVDVQVAGTFRSDQGDEPGRQLGLDEARHRRVNRALPGGSSTLTVNLIEPGTLYGDRVNQFDLRLAKILRFGRTRTNVGLDVYNVFNATRC